MKKNLLPFTPIAMLLKLLFIAQFASAQNSRIWATYYGQVNAAEGFSVATDAAGNVYLAGITNDSTGIAAGGFQDTLGGGIDGFLVKFDASGNRLWATYYGGLYQDQVFSVATDAAGNVYLAGTTSSPTGIASGGFQDTLLAAAGDAFLVKFDANGNRLWATYYGGSIGATGNSVATDAAGNVYLAGTTADSTGIASGGFQNTCGGGQDAFLVKFDTNGNRLWATYYGGSGAEWGNSVATDAAGNVYLAGTTTSTDSIAAGGFKNIFGRGFWDSFLVKFDANGNRLWATYYGGMFDNGNSVATDAAGNVYLAGTTTDSTGIASGGFQNTFGGGLDLLYGDAYLVKFDANGNRLWATYYGGSGDEIGNSVATDAAGNVYLAGLTGSYDSIASGGFLDTFYGDNTLTSDLFLVKFDANGNRQCASYYPAIPKTVVLTGLALDAAGNVYMGASTDSTTGIASGGFQNTYGGDGTWWDADLIKFTSCTDLTPVANFQSSDTIFCANECINYTNVSKNGPTHWQWSFPGGIPSSSTIQNPQGICYDSAGTFDATLIASNSGGSDTLTFTNHIKVFVTPPTPVITQHGDTLYCTTDPSYTSYQWYDSTSLIPGATDTFLVITHGGNYNVAVHNEFGCKISVGITIAHNVGINEFSDNNYISLSPNPASDELLVSGNWKSETGKAKLTIFNILGEIIFTEEINSKQETVNCKPFSVGIYFVQVTNESGRWVGRFVKE